MDYKYYLFKDENYGDIYTNYDSFYNKKLKENKDKLLGKTFFNMLFLCLIFTIISVICYAIFDIKAIMWVAFIFLGLAVIFEILFIFFGVRYTKEEYIKDFKLTKEYSDQVDKYKIEKTKKYIEYLFKIIDKYNELKKDQNKKDAEKKQKEITTKLDELVDKIAGRVKEIVEDGNTKAIEDYVKVIRQTTIETIKEKELEKDAPATEELKTKEESKEKATQKNNRKKNSSK